MFAAQLKRKSLGAVLSLGNNVPLAVTFSLQGPALSDDERRLFAASNPFGFILFARNIDNPEQVKELCADLREAVGRECPILIDQEGGRVQRMKPPHWAKYPAMRELADDLDALQETIVGIAKDLVEVGIDVNCAPVLDVLQPDTHDAIGDRAFSNDPDVVAACGQVVCETLLEYGVTPVIKHLPGLGRAKIDSHKDLPRVEADTVALQTDYAPFRDIMAGPYADSLWGMVAHVLFTAYDSEFPSSSCPKAIQVIREEIGFEGLLLSDDLDMEALHGLGDISHRALCTLEAGCDIALYCAGNIKVMETLAETVPQMRADSVERYERSRVRRRSAA